MRHKERILFAATVVFALVSGCLVILAIYFYQQSDDQICESNARAQNNARVMWAYVLNEFLDPSEEVNELIKVLDEQLPAVTCQNGELVEI